MKYHTNKFRFASVDCLSPFFKLISNGKNSYIFYLHIEVYVNKMIFLLQEFKTNINFALCSISPQNPFSCIKHSKKHTWHILKS